MIFFLNSLFFSVLQPPLIRIIELCHESPITVYFAFVTEFYVITVYENIETDNDFDEFLEDSLDISYAIVTDDDSRPPPPKKSKPI